MITHITSSSVDSVGSIFAELFNCLKVSCVERGGWKIQDRMVPHISWI